MNVYNAYRENTAQNANPVRLVILLYEQLIKDLRQAVAALDRHDVEARTQEIDHALLVVGQLQGTLSLDKGGQVAQDLDRFYYLLRRSLLEAQAQGARGILQGQVESLMTLREAWTEVERVEQTKAFPNRAEPGSSTPSLPPPSPDATLDWKA